MRRNHQKNWKDNTECKKKLANHVSDKRPTSIQEGEEICIHIAGSLHWAAETIRTLQSNYIPIKKNPKYIKKLLCLNNKKANNITKNGQRIWRYFSKEDIHLFKKHMKVSLTFREMQIKTISYHFIPTKMALIKEQIITTDSRYIKKLKSLYITGRNVKWHSTSEIFSGSSLKNYT